MHRTAAARFTREKLFLFLLLLAAFLSRAVFILITSGTSPVFDKYFWLADKLAGTAWVPNVVFADCPLFIYIIGFLHTVLGLGEPELRMLQALLSPLVIYLAWRFTTSVAGPYVASIAATVLAFYPALILYDTQPMPFVWINLANTATLFFLFKAARERAYRYAVLAGLCLGCSLLLRPNVLLWLPFLIIWLLVEGWKERKRAALNVSLFVIALALTVAPIAVINTRSGGDFVLVTASGGLNLFGGNNPDYNPLGCTSFPIVRHVQTYIVGNSVNEPITPEHLAYRRVAQWLSGKSLTAKAASEFWERETLAYARRDPAAFLAGLANKFRHFFSAYEAHDTDSAYVRWQAFGHTPIVFFSLIWAVAVVGIVSSLRRWRDFSPLLSLFFVYFANTVLFYVSSRLRLPVMLPVSVFAGLGIQALFQLRHQERPYKLAAALASAALLAGLFAWPTRATTVTEHSLSVYVLHFTPGSNNLMKGNRAEALREFSAALELSPDTKGSILALLAPYSQDPLVQDFISRVPPSTPPKPDSLGEKSEFLRWRGVERAMSQDNRGALADFSEALVLRPYDWDIYYSRSVISMRLGRWADVLRDLERSFEYGKKFQTDLHVLYFELGLAAAQSGDIAKAREYLRRSLFVKPQYQPAAELLATLEKS